MSPPGWSFDRLSSESQPSHWRAGRRSDSATRRTLSSVRPQTSVERTTVSERGRESPARTCNKAGSPPTTRERSNSTAPAAASRSTAIRAGPRATQCVNRHRPASGLGPADARQDRALARLARQREGTPLRRQVAVPHVQQRQAAGDRFGLLEHHVEVFQPQAAALDAQEGGRPTVVGLAGRLLTPLLQRPRHVPDQQRPETAAGANSHFTIRKGG